MNFQRIAAGDTTAASLLPFSVWLDGSLAADRFYPYLAENFPGQTQGFQVRGGHAYSGYPIALPLLVTPFYGPAALMVKAASWDTARVVLLSGVLEKLAASALAALTVAFFYLLVLRLTSPLRAMLLTLAYAFATETWTISSQALWQHGGGELGVILGLLGLVRLHESPASRAAVFTAGLGAALAAAIRPTNVLFLGAAALWLVLSRSTLARWAWFSAAPVALGSATLLYNLRVFGNPFGGYELSFDGRFWEGLAGLLWSPSRGLLIYTPIVLVSLLGAGIALRRRRNYASPVWLVSWLFPVALLLVNAKWRIWWGGHCFGPRLLTDAVPCLVLLLLPALDLASRRRFLQASIGGLLVISVLIQTIGAFCYPASHWDERPVSIGARPERLWDWSDNPLSRSIAAGPRLGPDRRLAPLLRMF